MVSWGGEENRVREARSEGSRADRLALENAPLSPTLTPYRNPRIDHFPFLLSPWQLLDPLVRGLEAGDRSKTNKNRPRKLSVVRQGEGSRRTANAEKSER